MKSTLFINLLTTSSLQNKDDGRKLLKLWIDLLPNYIPDKFGNYEPLRNKFDPGNLEIALSQWNWPFLFKKRKPKLNGGVYQPLPNQHVHGSISFKLEFNLSDQQALIKFLQETSVHFKADFAFMHLITRDEFDKSDRLNTASWGMKRTEPNLFVTSYDLRKNIPDLYWATVFGPAYVKLFGEERLLSTPIGTAKKISDSAVYLQVTENLSDLEKGYDGFNLSRQKNKEYLDSNAFFDEKNDPSHAYNVPRFQLDRLSSDPKDQPIAIENPIEVNYCDQAIFDLSQLLLYDTERLGFDVTPPSKTLLDYSIESLSEINRYLDKLRLKPYFEAGWDKLILRCGAYVGEV